MGSVPSAKWRKELERPVSRCALIMKALGPVTLIGRIFVENNVSFALPFDGSFQFSTNEALSEEKISSASPPKIRLSHSVHLKIILYKSELIRIVC